jgi:hypothetical protein
VRNWPATIVEDSSPHNDAFAEWFTRMLPSEIAIRFSDVVMPKHGAGYLGKSMGQNDQRFAWGAQNRCAIRRVQRHRLAVWFVKPVGSDFDHFLHPSVLTLLNEYLLHHLQPSAGRFKSANSAQKEVYVSFRETLCRRARTCDVRMMKLERVLTAAQLDRDPFGLG